MSSSGFSSHLEHFRKLHADSEMRRPLTHPDDVARYWDSKTNLQNTLVEKLRALIVSTKWTGFGGADLVAIARALLFEEEIGSGNVGMRRAVQAIWHSTGTAPLLTPDRPEWSEAIDLGRGLVVLGVSVLAVMNDIAPCRSAKRLVGNGFKLSAVNGQYQFVAGELERATERIKNIFDEIGIVGSLNRITGLIQKYERYAFGMFLFARISSIQPRQPTYPYGFLLNLALRCPMVSVEPRDADTRFAEAADFARDLISSLDLETYFFAEAIFVDPLGIEARLRKTAHFDHLIGIKQWPAEQTDFLLRSFFEACIVSEKEMTEKLGWCIADALKLWGFIAKKMPQHFSWLTTKKQLARSGIANERLLALLSVLTHPHGTVNIGYVSPESAAYDPSGGQMAFLRPFIALENKSLLIPIPSAAGPAFYEALMGVLFVKYKNEANDLLGSGTERIAAALLKKAKFPEPIVNAKYLLRRPTEEGELDLVIETQTHILFLECKAKAPTRDTMAGGSVEALLDYSAAILEGQIQALRHERILRERGTIEFLEGGKLEVNGRKIVRLCVTLLDHGALQDFALISGLTSAIMRLEITPVAGYKKAKQVMDLGRLIHELRDEVSALNKVGLDFRKLRLSTRSVSVAQLAVLLDGCQSPDEFICRITSMSVFGTQNTLLEYLTIQQIKGYPSKSEIIKPSRIRPKPS